MDESLASGSGSVAEPQSIAKALTGAATPLLYRSNAFRITGLGIQASPRDIDRQVKQLDILEKFGDQTALGRTPLSLDPPPDTFTVRAAAQKLRDPAERLIDELFWFWPEEMGQDADDLGLGHLRIGDLQSARHHWQSRASEASGNGYVAIHNLAVLDHLQALDFAAVEVFPQEGDPLPDDAGVLRDQLQTALQGWHRFEQERSAWSRLEIRATEMDDPRVSSAVVATLRAQLPLALLGITAQLAARFAEQGRRRSAAQCLEAMEHSGYPEEEAREAVVLSLRPLRDRIRQACQDAETRVPDNRKQADGIARQLLDTCRPMLEVLDCLLPQGHAVREGTHDNVALAALTAQVAYGNETDDWTTSLALLEAALPFAEGGEAQTRISDNIAIVNRNLDFATCFFCKERPAEGEAGIEVNMYGDVQSYQVAYNTTRTTWRQWSINVPRCAPCKTTHSALASAAGASGVGGCTGLVLVGGVGLAAAEIAGLRVFSSSGDLTANGSTILWVLIGLAIAGAIAGGIFWSRHVKANMPTLVATKPEASNTSFPAVQEKQKQGWQFGKGPTAS